MLPRNPSAAAAAPAGPVFQENAVSLLSAPRSRIKSCFSGSLPRFLVLYSCTPQTCRVSVRSSSTTWKGRFPLRSSKGGEKREKPARRKWGDARPGFSCLVALIHLGVGDPEGPICCDGAGRNSQQLLPLLTQTPVLTSHPCAKLLFKNFPHQKACFCGNLFSPSVFLPTPSSFTPSVSVSSRSFAAKFFSECGWAAHVPPLRGS